MSSAERMFKVAIRAASDEFDDILLKLTDVMSLKKLQKMIPSIYSFENDMDMHIWEDCEDG